MYPTQLAFNLNFLLFFFYFSVLTQMGLSAEVDMIYSRAVALFCKPSAKVAVVKVLKKKKQSNHRLYIIKLLCVPLYYHHQPQRRHNITTSLSLHHSCSVHTQLTTSLAKHTGWWSLSRPSTYTLMISTAGRVQENTLYILCFSPVRIYLAILL